MNYYEDDDIVAQVRRTRAQLLEEYGGIEGYNAHIREEEAKMKAQGAKFLSPSPEYAEKMRQIISRL